LKGFDVTTGGDDHLFNFARFFIDGIQTAHLHSPYQVGVTVFGSRQRPEAQSA
jgi:hypothetical protein